LGYPGLAKLGYGLILRIDHYAHFGGLVGGFLIATAIGVQYRSSERSRLIAGIAYVVMAVVFAVLIA